MLVTRAEHVAPVDRWRHARENCYNIPMLWEYKIVPLGLLVDATEPNQREKHEQILNELGQEEWEAFAYSAQSDTVLLKRPVQKTG